MKKLLLLLAFIPCLALAQTKEETEKWILDQFPLMNQDISYKIEGGEIIRKDKDPYVLGSGYSTTTIPLAKVKTISLQPSDKAMAFLLKCEEDCSYWVRVNSNGKFEKDSKHAGLVVTAFPKGDKLDKTLIPRMEKALLHLIKLNGGDAKVVPFVKKKEAF